MLDDGGYVAVDADGVSYGRRSPAIRERVEKVRAGYAPPRP